MKKTAKKTNCGPMPAAEVYLSQNAVKAADRAFGLINYKRIPANKKSP